MCKHYKQHVAPDYNIERQPRESFFIKKKEEEIKSNCITPPFCLP